MKHFRKIADYDVSGAVAQLRDHPDLWGQIPFRTMPGSPHEGCPDIWLRFRGFNDTARDPIRAIDLHISEFYPPWWVLTELHPIVYDLMARVKAVQLGGILLTKIPAGRGVKLHADKGWHPQFYSTKVYVALESNPKCINLCADEEANIRVGEAMEFNNLLPHAVANNGETDRVTMIVCMRNELIP